MKFRSILFSLILFITIAKAQTSNCPPDDKTQLKQIEGYITELQTDTAKFNAFIDKVFERSQYTSIIEPILIKAFQQSKLQSNAGKEIDELLSVEDWDKVKNIVCELLLNGELAEVVISKGPNNGLKFFIDSVEYQNKGDYSTMYTSKIIEIQAVKIDPASKVKIDKTKWMLNGKEIIAKKGDTLQLRIDKVNLPKEANELIVYDSVGSKLSGLDIKIYYAPIVKFDEARSFNGEYFFDHGYEYPSLANNIQYNVINVGKKGETYFASVLGLSEGQAATLRVDVRDLVSAAKKDKNFKLVFKPRLANKIYINNKDSLLVKGDSLHLLNSVSIIARTPINGITLTPMLIDVFVQSTREKVGMLEYYCAQQEDKRVTLVYTKCNDERNFPSYLPHPSLQNYLNANSLNQLFINAIVDTLQFTPNRSTSYFQKFATSSLILDTLQVLKWGSQGGGGQGFNSDWDFFFITNLSIPGSVPGSMKGGFHKSRAEGGMQVKFIQGKYSETAYELATHELGHWMGLPHTWEKNSDVTIIIAGSSAPTAGGETGDNFMDYNVKRKKWLKIQLLKYRR